MKLIYYRKRDLGWNYRGANSQRGLIRLHLRRMERGPGGPARSREIHVEKSTVMYLDVEKSCVYMFGFWVSPALLAVMCYQISGGFLWLPSLHIALGMDISKIRVVSFVLGYQWIYSTCLLSSGHSASLADAEATPCISTVLKMPLSMLKSIALRKQKEERFMPGLLYGDAKMLC